MANKTPHSFNILMTEEQFAKLSSLAHENQCTRAHIIRTCLRWRLMMHESHQPICADGGRCVAAHLHPLRQAPTPPLDH